MMANIQAPITHKAFLEYQLPRDPYATTSTPVYIATPSLNVSDSAVTINMTATYGHFHCLDFCQARIWENSQTGTF